MRTEPEIYSKPFIVELGKMIYENGSWNINGMVEPLYFKGFRTLDEAQAAFNDLHPRDAFEKEAGVRGGVSRMKNEGYYTRLYYLHHDEETEETAAWRNWTQEDAWSWYIHGEGLYRIVLPHMQDQPEPAYIETEVEYAALVQQAEEMGGYGVKFVEE